ncbi:MAG: TRAP transporter small permease [Silicimonas sp.]
MSAIHKIASGATTVISTLAGYIAVVALAFLIASATIDVAYRTVTGSSLFYGLLEYGEAALVVLAFLGSIRTQYSNGHVSSTLVTSKLSPKLRGWIRAVSLFLVAVLLVWAAYASGAAAIKSFHSGEVRFGLVRIPLWPIRSVVPVSFGLLSVLLMRQAWDYFQIATGRTAFEPTEEATELSI